MLKFGPATAGVVAACFLASSAIAQNQYESQIQLYLGLAETLVESEGYVPVLDPLIGSLDDSGSRTYEVSMVRGGRYKVVGVCDNDCSDVDIKVLDPNGQLVAEDLLIDDAPIVNVSPDSTGKYRVRVLMVDCDASSCYYGVRVFAR